MSQSHNDLAMHMGKPVSKLVEKVAKAMIETYNNIDHHVRPFLYDEALKDPRHGTIEAARSAIETVKQQLKDHYWDSLEKDKEMIMLHIEAILK